jgi:hypothetical protein
MARPIHCVADEKTCVEQIRKNRRLQLQRDIHKEINMFLLEEKETRARI